MLKIAVCDGEDNELEYTSSIVEYYSILRSDLDIKLQRFTNGKELLDFVKIGNLFDFYLLDVLLPDINGIELGEAIRERDSIGVLIYLSTSKNYALASYRVEAQGFLLKPFKELDLIKILDKATIRLEAENAKRLRVYAESGVKAIPFYTIICIEMNEHHLYCNLIDGKQEVSSILSRHFEEEIKPLNMDRRFVQISTYSIVNMQHIRAVIKKGFVLANGEEVSITEGYESAKRIYFNYLQETGE